MREKEIKDAKITFRLPQRVKDEVEEVCSEKDVSVASYVLAAIKAYLKDERK